MSHEHHIRREGKPRDSAGGLSRTPEYGIWRGMRRRCHEKKNRQYAEYGGRGIRVCERWRTSFLAFYEDVGPRPSPGHSLDRYPNNDGNYEPGNVRWATATQQQWNTRDTRMLTAFGKTQPLRAWAREVGVRPSTISARVAKGLSIEEAIGRPSLHGHRSTVFLTHDGVTKSVKQWAEETGMSPATLLGRINRGYSSAECLAPPRPGIRRAPAAPADVTRSQLGRP